MPNQRAARSCHGLEILNELVLAEPRNQASRELLAATNEMTDLVPADLTGD